MSDRVTFRRRLVVAALVTLVGGVAFSVYALRIDQIRVTGVRTLDPRQVIEASGLKGGERLLWIRLSSVARRIERIPAVASVTAERSFPQTVVLLVHERTPVARLASPGLAVDSEGRMFASPDASRFPLLEGWRGKADAGESVDHASVGVLEAFGAFPSTLRQRTMRIVIGPPLTLVLVDGTEVRFGFHEDLVRKARVAEAVLTAEAGQKLEYVDVRAPGVPVSRRRAPPTPAPTPVPTAAPAPATASAPPATPAPAPTASP